MKFFAKRSSDFESPGHVLLPERPNLQTTSKTRFSRVPRSATETSFRVQVDFRHFADVDVELLLSTFAGVDRLTSLTFHGGICTSKSLAQMLEFIGLSSRLRELYLFELPLIPSEPKLAFRKEAAAILCDVRNGICICA